ncbi:hypothetical protein K438DRAFT_1772809 [Mycena galopus ATCC 62051]|nr:hypothetical protein K438DRAFT_1772809 [Mycena galopus ATCC 62051]
MERKYFKLWPEEDVLDIVAPEDDGSGDAPAAMSVEDAKILGNATAVRKKQLTSWFNNQGQKIKRQMDTVGPSKSGSYVAKLFKRLSKRRHRLQEVEIFQKRNKRLINDAKGAGSKPKLDLKGRLEVMRARQKIVQKLWKRATAAEKAAVRKYMKQQAHITEDLFDKPIEDRTPEEIQSALNELPAIIAQFHDGIYMMTGWLGATLLGGPTPEEGAAVSQKT